MSDKEKDLRAALYNAIKRWYAGPWSLRDEEPVTITEGMGGVSVTVGGRLVALIQPEPDAM